VLGSGRIRLPEEALLDIYRSSVYIGCMVTRRMQETTFLILASLASGSQHGYGIITDVLGISGGQIKLRAGTLYAALERLAREGLIEIDREEIVDSRLRRYYKLTSDGVERLAEEADRLRSNAGVAITRLDANRGVANA
jgi:DNA-binding PadR family transcriptional regulator